MAQTGLCMGLNMLEDTLWHRLDDIIMGLRFRKRSWTG